MHSRLVPLQTSRVDPDFAQCPANWSSRCCRVVQDERQEAELHKEEEEEGEDLCKCEFSLAYGAKILLNNTYLHLKRGKRYGLCGPNGCGKSTLMRAISNGQVCTRGSPPIHKGFPPLFFLFLMCKSQASAARQHAAASPCVQHVRPLCLHRA